MKRSEYISDEQVVKRARAAVRIEIEKRIAMDQSVIVYDRNTLKIYQIDSDGTKTELGDRLNQGRYSERKLQANDTRTNNN